MNRGAAALVVLAVPAVAITPANAASTRAEYIAQVDPICQSFAAPIKEARGAFIRKLKGLIRTDKSGDAKQFVRRTKSTGRSLNRLAEVRTSMTDQIAVVPPPDPDAGTIGTWLSYRRQGEAFERSEASAFKQQRLGQASRQHSRVDRAFSAGARAISGFGFQVCGTFPVG